MSDSDMDENPDQFNRYDYLHQHGQTLINNGYHVVPIRVGGKAPGFDGWEKSRPTKAQLTEWLENGHRWAGVGILTKLTPAVDIDVRDEKVALLLDAWVREHLGGKLVRIGQAPKRLFLFRCETPFRKMRTTVRMDEWGDKQQIEVLCDGQQFVAYHKHPETGKPYDWPDDGQNPLRVNANELPVLKPDQVDELFAYYEQLADSQGWEVAKAARSRPKSLDMSVDDPFVEDTSPVDMSDDELRARTLLVPNPDDYETWINVGMALHHQWDGGEIGLKLWHEWAETADNYDADALERRWDDFKIDGKRRAPITMRYVLKVAAEAVAHTTAQYTNKLRDMFSNAKDIIEWNKARDATRNAEVDGLARSGLAHIAKEALDKITGNKTSLVEIKKAIAYQPKNGEKIAGWAKAWVYDTSDDRFFNTEKKISVTQQGFNATHDRNALTKKDALDGKSSPSNTASALALNVYKIRTVDGRRYEPGQDSIFYGTDGVFANTYPEHEIPELPDKVLPRDKRNVDRVKHHIEHLLPKESEQRMFLDWISWVVQNPGRHANYAVLLQGVEGDGKSFWAQLLRTVMGVTNVRMLNAHIFESNFTDWTVGQCVACVEEVRIVKAQNKYEVINRIKPNITNDIIEVHPKGKAPYNAKNTTSYLLFSNYTDALPLDDDGRRYLVLFSQWQRREALLAFKRSRPDYYTKLYNAIDESPGALRKWLLDHSQHPDFDPMGDAPQTAARKFMIRQSKPEFILELNQLIAENTLLGVSDELLNITDLSEIFMARGLDMPMTRALSSMLQRDGWSEVGRVRVGSGLSRFWSRSHEKFFSYDSQGEPTLEPSKVREFLKKREQEIDDL